MTMIFFRRDPQIKIAQDTHNDMCLIYVILWSRGRRDNDFVTPDIYHLWVILRLKFLGERILVWANLQWLENSQEQTLIRIR